MKVIEKDDATATLGEYAGDIDSGPVIVTHPGMQLTGIRGRPTHPRHAYCRFPIMDGENRLSFSPLITANL